MPVNADYARLPQRNARRFVAPRMPTLSQIIAAHAPVLLLDAASSRIQIGWSERVDSVGAAGRPEWRWEISDDEATTAVFQCLERLGRNPAEAGAFLFCDGPGSVLGIRTVAMALRTWNVLNRRPVYGYCSLALLAQALGREELGVIADARRDSWHHYQLGRGLRRLPAAEIGGELVMPAEFRHWAPLPAPVTRVPYALADLLPRVSEADLFQQTDQPDAFLHEPPSYVTWSPQIHRAPGPTH
jgi:tRNA threonylcarbamoyladenosine biosynthesis protein TsaB